MWRPFSIRLCSAARLHPKSAVRTSKRGPNQRELACDEDSDVVRSAIGGEVVETACSMIDSVNDVKKSKFLDIRTSSLNAMIHTTDTQLPR